MVELNNKYIASHAGNADNENDLVSSLLVLDKFKDIDIVELDVVYVDGEFIIKHGHYDSGGDTLSSFVYALFTYKPNICVWLDLKDRRRTVFLPIQPVFDCQKFDNCLYILNKKINIKNRLFIGSIFHKLYDELRHCAFITKNISLVYDSVSALYYVPAEVVSEITFDKINISNNFNSSFTETRIYDDIVRDRRNITNIAIDISFFANNNIIRDFIKKIVNLKKYKCIILYPCCETNIIKIPRKKGVHIIYMYDFTLHR
jgi:hypothetical protein